MKSSRNRNRGPAMELRTALGPELPLSVEQVGQRLGLSIFTIRSLLRRGAIAHHKLGRRIIVFEGDVQAFLAANRIEARDGAVARGR